MTEIDLTEGSALAARELWAIHTSATTGNPVDVCKNLWDNHADHPAVLENRDYFMHLGHLVTEANHRPIAAQGWDICQKAEMAWRWAVTCARLVPTTKAPAHPPRNPFKEQ